MKFVLGAAVEVQRYLDASGERYCLIGALALQRWGEPRFTRDVDVTLLCPFGAEAAAVDRLLAKFKPRIEGARSLALQRRVLLLWSAGGIGVDIAFGALPKPLLELRETPDNLERLQQLRSKVEKGA